MNAGRKCFNQRIRLSMTLGELARDSGVRADSLAEFEKGSKILPEWQIERIADALMLRCEYVMNDKYRKRHQFYEPGLPCFFDDSIECFDCSNCYKCGWNPEVARARKQNHKADRKVLYENFLY